MSFDEFTGGIQHRLELPGIGEAVRAVRATLTALGRRIPEGDPTDLASALPMEVDWYLTGAVHEHGQRFDWEDLVASTVPEADVRQLLDQLPADDG